MSQESKKEVMAFFKKINPFGKQVKDRLASTQGELEKMQHLVKQQQEKIRELEQKLKQKADDDDTDGSMSLVGSGRFSPSIFEGVKHLSKEKEGIFARPIGKEKCQGSNLKEKKKSWFSSRRMESGAKHESIRLNTLQSKATTIYDKFTALDEAMELSRNFDWKKGKYTCIAKLLRDLPVPRVTFDALKQTLDDASSPLSLMIEDKQEVSSAKEVNWDIFHKVIWANKAELDWFNIETLEQRSKLAARGRVVHFLRETFQAIIDSTFQEGDVQPKRQLYYKFKNYDVAGIQKGTGTGVFNAATQYMMQNSIILIEFEGNVHAGLFYELNTPQKYGKEIINIMTRSHALFKYTESAMTVFTYDGTIVQQNPVSMRYLGMAATENVIYTDVDESGKPVNRLRAFFGDSKSLYDGMWETIREHKRWGPKRMKVFKHDMKYVELAGSFADMDLTEARDMDPGIWINIQVIPFVDPSDGRKTLFMMFDNITKIVLSEQKMHEAKKHEHEILESMIPTHIINHLVDEKRNKLALDRSAASDKSNSSSCLLSISNVRNASDLAEHHDMVTILFTDVVGFTKMSVHCTPSQIMTMLNEMYSLFDNFTEDHDVYKVETIGDSYMCVTGLNLTSKSKKLRHNGQDKKMHHSDHAKCMLAFARDILNNLKEVKSPTNDALQIRVGIHSGECVTGVVGLKMPRFCLFRDTVNTASRMETTGKPGYIHASDTTRDLLPDEAWVATGGIDAKGKGMMDTFLLKP